MSRSTFFFWAHSCWKAVRIFRSSVEASSYAKRYTSLSAFCLTIDSPSAVTLAEIEAGCDCTTVVRKYNLNCRGCWCEPKHRITHIYKQNSHLDASVNWFA